MRRPFQSLSLPAELKAIYEREGVPMEHRPLDPAMLSECVADGLDADPGDLVADADGTWCIVINDAIGATARA